MTLTEVFTDEVVVSHSEAIAEVVKHGIDPNEFLLEMGYLDEYSARAVLEWLGY